MGPFSPKEIAAELVFELLDGPGQRRLRHIARFRHLGEIQLAGRRQEISDLMHLHGKAISAHSFRDACRASFSQASRNRFVTEPFFAHSLPYQRADTRRVGSAPDRDQINLSPELRFNDGQRDYPRMLDGICGHEGKP
jgi:hypothetical protein